MRRVRTSDNERHVRLRRFLAALASVAVVSVALADQMVTNAAGVRAGITGIVYRRSDNSIGIQFAVQDPAKTNVTTFTIQQSFDLTNWVNSYPTNIVVGDSSGEASGGFATPTKQFYRMQLINF